MELIQKRRIWWFCCRQKDTSAADDDNLKFFPVYDTNGNFLGYEYTEAFDYETELDELKEIAEITKLDEPEIIYHEKGDLVSLLILQ